MVSSFAASCLPARGTEQADRHRAEYMRDFAKFPIFRLAKDKISGQIGFYRPNPRGVGQVETVKVYIEPD